MFQNRIAPTGEIIKTKARGTFMGNRGVIHDAGQNIVRTFKHKAWITCSLQFKERHRAVMSPNRWTELFFLDEATAFAAGHRPCCECRRENFNQFKSSWIMGNPRYGFEPSVSIKEIDHILHEERIDKLYGKVMYPAKIQDLPDGTFVFRECDSYLVVAGLLYKWSPVGYAKGTPVSKIELLNVLTPRSIVNAFKSGYHPAFSLALV